MFVTLDSCKYLYHKRLFIEVYLFKLIIVVERIDRIIKITIFLVDCHIHRVLCR
nr:MAG TPA: hypothetical protein [Bacteriophage sp.]